MSGNSHNAGSNANFWIGETRAQVAAHVSASYPLNGPVVMYNSGLDSSLSCYKTEVAQAVGGSGAATLTVNAVVCVDGTSSSPRLTVIQE